MSVRLLVGRPNIFTIILQKQSYLNVLYLLLALPLGVIYFVVLVTGMALSLGLAITWFSVPVSFATLVAVRKLAALERNLTVWLLNADIKETSTQPTPHLGLWKQIRAYIFDANTWRNLIYLLVKLPLGVLSFSITVTLLVLAIALILTPIAYAINRDWIAIQVFKLQVDTMVKSLLAAPVGFGIGLFSLYVTNGIAWASKRWAWLMLEQGSNW